MCRWLGAVGALPHRDPSMRRRRGACWYEIHRSNHSRRCPVTAAATPASSPAFSAVQSERQKFLDAYEREHAITMKVLRAYPPEKSELQPHPKCKPARDLAWIFVLERGLGKA